MDQMCPCPRADGPKFPCRGGRSMFLPTSELLQDPFVAGTQPEAWKGEWADRCPADQPSPLQQGGPRPSLWLLGTGREWLSPHLLWQEDVLR